MTESEAEHWAVSDLDFLSRLLLILLRYVRSRGAPDTEKQRRKGDGERDYKPKPIYRFDEPRRRLSGLPR